MWSVKPKMLSLLTWGRVHSGYNIPFPHCQTFCKQGNTLWGFCLQTLFTFPCWFPKFPALACLSSMKLNCSSLSKLTLFHFHKDISHFACLSTWLMSALTDFQIQPKTQNLEVSLMLRANLVDRLYWICQGWHRIKETKQIRECAVGWTIFLFWLLERL